MVNFNIVQAMAASGGVRSMSSGLRLPCYASRYTWRVPLMAYLVPLLPCACAPGHSTLLQGKSMTGERGSRK